MQHRTDVPVTEAAAPAAAETPDQDGARRPPEGSARPAETATAGRRNRKAWVVGSSTLACAVGGALLGAFAFSAYPGALSGPGGSSDSLASGTLQSPGNTGALCTSWRNTATAADTAISCENYGLSSFGDRLARAMQMRYRSERVGSRGSRSTAASHSHSSVGKLVNAATSDKKTPAASLPSMTSPTSKTKSTCVSAPTSGTSSGSGVTASVSGGGGSVTVKAGSAGLSVCGRTPTSAKLPASLPTTSTLPSVPGVTTTQKKALSGLSGTVDEVTGTLGGL